MVKIDELDKQITNGFKEAGEKPYRSTSGADLIATLNKSRERLITTLIHKFGANGSKEKLDARERRLRGERSAAVYLKELAEKLPLGFKAKGDIFVFVDECHRTQGGVMNLAMKKIMGGQLRYVHSGDEIRI